MKKVFLIGLCVLSSCAQMNKETAMNNKSENQDVYSEMYRPQFQAKEFIEFINLNRGVSESYKIDLRKYNPVSSYNDVDGLRV